MEESKMIIIGVTGQTGSGKSTVSTIIKSIQEQ